MKKTAVFCLLAALGAAALPDISGAVPGTAVAVAPVPAEAGAGPLLDVNRATLAELVAVPGIGPSIAGAILEARRRRGGFGTLGDLLEVKGIGERRLAELARHLEVGAPGAGGGEAGEE